MGTFTFAAADFIAFDFRGSKLIIGDPATSADADYTIDCLAEYIVKVRGRTSLPSRKSTHIVTSFGTLCAGIDPLSSVIKSAQPAQTPNGKNTILLKLRI
jgi:hypothetical protein